MTSRFDVFIDLFNKKTLDPALLLKGKWGLEKEFLRVDGEGDLAQTPHPIVFGDKLTNPLITTDYSESQVELITPPLESINAVYDYLENAQKDVDVNLGDEYAWPMSMPSRLPEEKDIPIARYGDSKEGQAKEAYRQYLADQYGKKMQLVSGIHYNASFSEELFEVLVKKQNYEGSIQNFKTESYFALGRNFLRYKWLFIYLFGATPVVDKSYEPAFIKKMELFGNWWCPCLKKESYYLRHATSLRMSRLGYSNTLKGEVGVSYNSLSDYVRDIREAIAKKSLINEAEYYSLIRFKQVPVEGESLLTTLEREGINHVEIRALDINPFLPLGVSKSRLYFCHVFMIFCLLETSPDFGLESKSNTLKNQETVALSGRASGIELLDENSELVLMEDWSISIFEKLEQIATMLDGVDGGDVYSTVIMRQKRKIKDPELLPSAKILAAMKNECESFLEFGVRTMKSNKNE